MQHSTNAIGTARQLQRGESLTEVVVRELERMIMNREIKSGDRINEQLLATQMGTSRGPIREARRALERAGLVVGLANRGLFVRRLDRKEVEEMYDLRALVTGFVCGHLASNVTLEQVAELRAAVLQMRGDEAAHNAAKYFQANLRFHDLLMTFANHAQAKRANDECVQKMQLVRIQVITPEIANEEHAAIVEAIASGNELLARQLGEAHVLGGKRRWLAQTDDL